jgi:hypothetical protein
MMHDTLMGEIRWLLWQSQTPLSRAELLKQATLTDSGDEISATLNWMGNKTSPPQIERFGAGGKGAPFRYALTEAGRLKVAQAALARGEPVRRSKPFAAVASDVVQVKPVQAVEPVCDAVSEPVSPAPTAVPVPVTVPTRPPLPDNWADRPGVIEHRPPEAAGWAIADDGSIALIGDGLRGEVIEFERERAVRMARMILACDAALRELETA